MLIEEMDKTIQSEQAKLTEEVSVRNTKEADITALNEEKQQLLELLNQKDSSM